MTVADRGVGLLDLGYQVKKGIARARIPQLQVNIGDNPGSKGDSSDNPGKLRLLTAGPRAAAEGNKRPQRIGFGHILPPHPPTPGAWDLDQQAARRGNTGEREVKLQLKGGQLPYLPRTLQLNNRDSTSTQIEGLPITGCQGVLRDREVLPPLRNGLTQDL